MGSTETLPGLIFVFPFTDSLDRPCDAALQGRMCAVCSEDGEYLGLTPDGST